MLTYHASSERRGAKKMVRHALRPAQNVRLATPRHFMVVAHGPDWSIDGEYLVWNRNGGMHIFVLSPKTGGLPQQSSRLSYQRAPVMRRPPRACRSPAKRRSFADRTGSPEAVTRPRLPQNVACGFPALRSSEVGSQHGDRLWFRVRKEQLWSPNRFRCYPFESHCHGWRFFSLHRRPIPPIVWSPCCPRTGRLSRPRSTISQSDFRQVIGSSSPCRLVGPYKLRLNLTDLPLFTQKPLAACRRYEPRKHPRTLAFVHPGTPSSPLGRQGRLLQPRSISGPMFPFTLVLPTASLSTLRSVRCRAPRKSGYAAAG